MDLERAQPHSYPVHHSLDFDGSAAVESVKAFGLWVGSALPPQEILLRFSGGALVRRFTVRCLFPDLAALAANNRFFKNSRLVVPVPPGIGHGESLSNRDSQ